MRLALIPPLALAIAGCASTGAVERTPAVAAPVYNVSGLQAVMGQSAEALIQSFGQPDLDVREGTARKLQFSGPACVLDAYLYPSGGRVQVAHVDARQPNGDNIDRASCVAALQQARR